MATNDVLTFIEYDELLDYIDNENIDEVRKMFVQFGLTVNSPLFDAPRYNAAGDELFTYQDYIIAHSLIALLDYCIENEYIKVNDTLFYLCVQNHALDVYEYLRESYPNSYPAEQTLCESVKLCYSELTAELLISNPQLIYCIDDSTLEYLFSFDIDEETLETIRVLFNYNINPMLFNSYLAHLYNPEDSYFKIAEDDKDLVIELIDILESNGVVASQI